MTPEQVQQVRQALRNCRLRNRTPDARILDAVQHAKQSVQYAEHSEMKRPGAVDSSNRAGGDLSNERQANNST